LFREQQKRVSELHTIRRIVQQLMPLHESASAAAVIDQELKALIDCHSCHVFLLDSDEQVLSAVTDKDSASPPIRLTMGEGFAGWAAAHGRSGIIVNTLDDPRGMHFTGTERREESLIGVPLICEGKVRGVITLSKLGTNQFDENALRMVEIIAAQAAITLDRTRLYDELRLQALTDELTHLYNRRYLFQRFKEERARAQRHQSTLALIMLDIDTFKRISDTFGHEAGDAVLQELARVIRIRVRPDDIVARHGGEEFCILLPETEREELEKVAERLRAGIERHRLTPSCGARSITVSLGTALSSPADPELQGFANADRALYRAKRLGGNCVCL